MLDLLYNPNVWAAFATLTVMEIVLGIDNIVFLSVLVSRLPKEQADKARRLGLALALVFRIALLLVISWIIALDNDLFEVFGVGISIVRSSVPSGAKRRNSPIPEKAPLVTLQT